MTTPVLGNPTCTKNNQPCKFFGRIIAKHILPLWQKMSFIPIKWLFNITGKEFKPDHSRLIMILKLNDYLCHVINGSVNIKTVPCMFVPQA